MNPLHYKHYIINIIYKYNNYINILYKYNIIIHLNNNI